MLIFAGLGNPGAKYDYNRHNIGFLAVDALARRWSFSPWRAKFQGLACEGSIGPERALLLKPQTFMNESGRSVGEALKFFKLDPDALVVFHDELDLAPGRFRMKAGGGAAGHNGLRSIISQVGPYFRRGRMGIGHPGTKEQVLGYVLSDFHKTEAQWVKAMCDACADAAPMLVAGEDERYQGEVMRLAPAEKLDPARPPAENYKDMLGLSLPVLFASLIFSIPACFHIVRTGQDSFWLWIVLAFPFVGAIAYVAVIVIPGLLRGRTARKLGQGAREALDPHRDHREAQAAVDNSPTVHNRMRLAAAAAALGRHDEAEAVYREAAQGVHAEDPALQLGRAKALIELGRPAEALTLLEAIEREGESTAPATLAFARAYQGLRRTDEADRAYRAAMERIPGLEPIARYAAFLRADGRTIEANALIADIDARVAKTSGPFRKEAQAWQELAARG